MVNGANVVYQKWSTSKHEANNVACTTCHVGADTGGHPGVTVTSVACENCHAVKLSTATHPVAITASKCLVCHDSHSLASAGHAAANLVADLHYGGTAFIKAQYVSDASLPVSCTNCHGDLVNTTANQAILAQYTSSAHGSPLAEAWRHYDWRSSSRASCQRCHAGTAFVAKLGNENTTTNAYQPTDILKPGEVLNCSACHTDAGTGALRTAAEAVHHQHDERRHGHL